MTPEEHRILVDAIHDSATVIHKGRRMNERIQELAEQARKYAFEKVENSLDPTEWSTKYYNEMFDEKFAELIVRECIDCARGAGLADDVAVRNGLGFNDGISEAVTHMKKHFGVEI